MKRRPRAMTLLIMLMVIIILAVFAVLASEIFAASIRWIGRSGEAQTQATRFETVLRRLREDAWAAGQIQVDSAQSARLGSVSWSIAADGSITRKADATDIQHWPALNAALSFAAAERGLELQVNEKTAQEKILLPSQVLISRSPR